MTHRGTWTLAVVFAGLAAWVGLVEWPAIRRPPPPPAALLAEDPEHIARIELEGPGYTIVARREGTSWVDGAGRSWAFGAIDDLLGTLGQLRPLRAIAADADETAGYHIGAQRLRLLRGDGSVALDLALGDANPAETALYARMTGQPEVLLLGSVLRWELRKLEQGGSVESRREP